MPFPSVRRAVVAATAIGLLALGACGRAAPPPRWGTRLPWGEAVATAAGGGKVTGPLAVAAADDALVLADSFHDRLLVWRAADGAWGDPVRAAIPTGSPILAVAAAPGAAAPVYCATAGGGIWEVPAAAPPRRLAQLPADPQALERVVGMAAHRQGVWIDLVTIGADAAIRALVAVGTGGAHTLRRAVLATPAGPAPPAVPWLFSPAGVRQGLARGPDASIWLVGRDQQGRPVLWRLGADGQPAGRRRWPAALRQADFLGVAPSGLAYVLEDVGSVGQQLEGVTAGGSVRSRRPLPPGDGPYLPHPVAMAPDGGLAVLTAQADGLRVDWYPPQAVWRPGRP